MGAREENMKERGRLDRLGKELNLKADNLKAVSETLDSDRENLNVERKSFEELVVASEVPTDQPAIPVEQNIRASVDNAIAYVESLLFHSTFIYIPGGDSVDPRSIAYSKLVSAVASLKGAVERLQ